MAKTKKKKPIPPFKRKSQTVKITPKKSLIAEAKAGIKKLIKEAKDRNYAKNMVIIKFCGGKVSNPTKETDLLIAFRICLAKAPKTKFYTTNSVMQDIVLLSNVSNMRSRFITSLIAYDMANMRNAIYDFIIWFNSKNK
jgi:hypothetical protein